jgi:hypothetical protein
MIVYGAKTPFGRPFVSIFPSVMRRARSQRRTPLAGSCFRNGVMSCRWVFSPFQTTIGRFCGKPGHPYCPEHRREMDAMEQADKELG